MKKIFFSIFIGLISTAAMAITITGNVSDEYGPVIGADIKKSATSPTASTYTDESGNFRVVFDDDNIKKFYVSSIGLKTQEVKIQSGKTHYNITMSPDSEQITSSTVSAGAGDECNARATEIDPNATHGVYERGVGNSLRCKITKCRGGYDPDDTGRKCIKPGDPCSVESIDPNATGGTLKKRNGKLVCEITACNETRRPNNNGTKCVCDTPRYVAQGNQCVQKSGACNPKPAHAKDTHYEWNGSKYLCKIDSCESAQYRVKTNKNSDDECVNDVSGNCTSNIPNAARAVWKFSGIHNRKYCYVESCKTPQVYQVVNDEENALDGQCVQRSGKCDNPPANSLDTELIRSRDNKKMICYVHTCVSDRYDRDNSDPNRDGRCVDLVGQKCDPDEPVAFMAQPTYVWNEATQELECVVTDCKRGYIFDTESRKCIAETGSGDDCTDEAQTMDENATFGEYKKKDGKLVCVITHCADGFLPNDAGDKCIASAGECTPSGIEHATKGQLVKGVCKAIECEAGYIPKNGKCVATAGEPCPKSALPQNAKAGIRTLDENGQEYCRVTKCAEDFAITADERNCEFKLNQEQSAQRIKELDENYQAMREKETSLANKTIGAAGIGAVGIGGMQIASALSEQSADADAERDMAAYLATFRCDWGAGKTARGGDTNVALGGTGQITNLYREYMQLAADLKTRKAALDMAPGIESEVILNSAQTGLYDDVGTGKVASQFASVSDALLGNSAAWDAQKAATAQKLSTGIHVAGIGAVGSLVANLAVNTGKNAVKNRVDEIERKYENIMLGHIVEAFEQETRCPSDATGTPPHCTCNDKNKIFDSEKCVTCPDGTKPNADQTRCIDDQAPVDTVIDDITDDAIEEEILEGLHGVIIGGEYTTEYDHDEELSFSTNDLFDIGKYELSKAKQDTIIKTLQQWLQTTMTDADSYSCTLGVTGHTDPYWKGASKIMAYKYNMELSQKRAEHVTDILKRAFTDSQLYSILPAVGKGSSECTCGAGTSPMTGVCANATKETPVEYPNQYPACRRIAISLKCTKRTTSIANVQRITIPTTELFSTDGTAITPANVNKLVSLVKQTLGDKKQCNLSITAHTDPFHGYDYPEAAQEFNNQLSESRAQQVSTVLKNAFVGTNHTVTSAQGMGSSQCTCCVNGGSLDGACENQQCGDPVKYYDDYTGSDDLPYPACYRIEIDYACQDE